MWPAMAKKTTGTFWVFPQGSTKGYRTTCDTTGDFVRPTGVAPLFDPDAAKYATSDMVTNIVAASAATEHPIIIRGDSVSSARVLSGTHAWKQFLSLEEACGHAYLGKTMPSAETIRNRFNERLSEASELVA